LIVADVMQVDDAAREIKLTVPILFQPIHSLIAERETLPFVFTPLAYISGGILECHYE